MGLPRKVAGVACVCRRCLAPETRNPTGIPTAMTKTLTTRSLLLAGALAFAALPVLAQTAPSTQPAAPTTGSTVMPGGSADTGMSTGKTASSTSKAKTHTRKIASAHKSNVHHVSTKKHTTTSKTQKPASGSSTGTGTGGTQPQ